uniref:AlNc14C233G9331 protein n=1 Tax=Albugo laibachii Nc14 TaxID=890382 RepID=F0WSI8_9STRA|nr:AlNc14C233G9331 [Albugo laibachii Nc14]|eukprot:CCA24312.1 AlNc14C233G9331 [Albugo laibachii Nc14]
MDLYRPVMHDIPPQPNDQLSSYTSQQNAHYDTLLGAESRQYECGVITAISISLMASEPIGIVITTANRFRPKYPESANQKEATNNETETKTTRRKLDKFGLRTWLCIFSSFLSEYISALNIVTVIFY